MAASLGVFGIAAMVTAITAPLCRAAALRMRLVAHASDRSPDDRSRPMLGGVAMFCGAAAGFVAASSFIGVDGGRSARSVAAVVATAALTLLVGVVDDDLDLSPRTKLAGQVLACLPLIALGVTMPYIQVPGGHVVELGPVLAAAAAIVWVLAVSTAINFIDGLDGLAAGVVGISSISLALFAFRLDQIGLLVGDRSSVAPVLAVITAGVCAGFLTSNVHPARLIMGDGGALMLGVLVASTSMLISGQTTELPRSTLYFGLSPLLVPVVILGVPVMNIGWAVLRRARRGLHPAVSDKEHVHNRLMRLGHGHRRTVLILWLWTGVLSALALIPSFTDQSEALAPVLVLAGLTGFFTVLRPIRLERRRLLEHVTYSAVESS